MGTALGGMDRFMQQHGAGDAQLLHQGRDLQPSLRGNEACIGLAWGLPDLDREAMAQQAALQLFQITRRGR